MLKITRIEIKDFGRHKSIAQDTTGNIVGLTGPNGSGKSTVLQALQFALTGTIDHEDSLATFIRTDSTDKPPKNAQVSVWFTADGKPGRITRKITASATSRELTWDGKTLSADKAVTATLFEILGVDKKAVNSTVFIRQGAIGSMFGAELDRRDLYTRLLMLGHLAKVADVVDVYRKQVGDSVQDLSQARDTAQRSYDAALGLREECERELMGCTEVSAELQMISNLVTLFTVHAQAELATENAEKTRAGLGDGAQAATLMRELADAISVDEETIKALEARRDAFVDNDRRMAELRDNLGTTAELRRLHGECDSKRAELAAAAARVAEYSAVWERIQAAQQVVTLRNREVELPPLITAAQEKLAAEEARLVVGETKANELRKLLNVKAEELRMIQADLPARKMLRSAVTGQTACPCCGSENPDNAFLDRAIADLETRLPLVFAEVQELQFQVDPFERGVVKVKNDIVVLKSDLDAKTAELTRAGIILAGAADLEQATAQLAQLQMQNDARVAAEADQRRLTVEVGRIAQQIAGRPAPSDVVVEAWEDELATCAVAFTGPDEVWLPTHNATLSATKEGLPVKRARLRSMEQADSTLAAARTVLVDAETKLQEGLVTAITYPHIHPHLVGKQVTAADVHATAAALSALQSAYDAARGRLDGARRSLVNADVEIQGIDNKIAAQEERRKLVADLVLLRDTFKPSGATMEYLNYEFGRIAALAADHLAESGADFMVAASEDVPLAFEFLRLDRPDEVWLPQSKMSGGQKVRLAVATLRAIHSLIMPNVGILVLDEPTTHLDPTAKEAMADMLRRIGEENALQVIVCDHASVLVSAFTDQIIIPE